MRSPGRTTRGALGVVAAAALVLTGCGGQSTHSTGASGSADGGSARSGTKAADQRAAAGPSGQPAPGAGSPGGGTRNDARVLPADRDIVYRAQISVRVKDVAAAADSAESLARGVDGVVFAEETRNDPDSPAASTARLTLRVPPGEFRTVLRQLAGLGERLSQSQTAEDVTTQVVDTESRVASQRRSVARVRALLSEAKTIGEVVQVEAELSRREADLESLEAQLAKLKDVTELATIEASLVGPAAPAPKQKEALGFLAGLMGGWDAFARIVLVGLTVLGALLPFLVAAAVLGLPAWLLLLRLRRRTAPEPPAPAPTG
jgi:uncharacterized protein DUF4349